MSGNYFCCGMREHFVLGIVAERVDVPVPVDAADFIDFTAKMPNGKPVIRIKFCPFCGQAIKGPLRVFENPMGDDDEQA